MSHPSVFRAGFEPIPGYVLRQRLGAGGYGEVWSADAPGGLKKAIKLVYGTLDERRASTELRSLQRIRQVHHPLLLSLERIEVIDGQLIIVSELAEGSLMDVFHAARRRELQGIPRDQLLDFLRDAGDALDFLSQKHDLQHLDVKPGNLLIMADRIKVADFGLIKDLHDVNLSVVSGLTPTHAAPELFDGRPDRLSDLYSLAIVYQEMLTGKLPFEGKTAGELARQHLHQPPNLEPLPPADRRVVARALAKHPLDRYPSCRAFVEELRSSGAHEKYAVKTRINEIEPSATGDASHSSLPLQSSTCTSTAMLGGVEIMSPLPTTDSADGWHAPLCMFIGVGGMGCQTLTSLRALLDQKGDARRPIDMHQWLAIDTDFDLLAEVSSSHHRGHIEYRDTCHLKLFRPQEYRERSDDRFAAISRRWLYNIPRSLKTEGVRPLGMLALVDHWERVEQRIYDQLKALLAAREHWEGSHGQPLRIYICGSLHGGTGGAVSADIAHMVRSALAQLDCSDYFLMGTMSIATTMGAGGRLPAAAALAALCELDAQMQGTHFIPTVGRAASLKASASAKPFDWVTLVDGGLHGSAEAASSTIDALAEALWVDSHTLIGTTLDQARHERGARYARQHRPWLRASRSSLVQLGQSLEPVQLARLCCAQAIQRWHSCIAGTAVAQAANDFPGQSVGWSAAQTASVVEHLSRECLRAMGLTTERDPQATTTASATSPWRSRASQNLESVRAQLDRDLHTFHQWFTGHMRPSYVSWKILQRTVLRAVERMIELASSDALMQALATDDAGDSEPLAAGDLANCRKYLQLLSSKCLQRLQLAQPPIEHLGKSLGTWLSRLQTEEKMQVGLSDWAAAEGNIPIGWRHMLQRVSGVLDTSLHRYIVDRCFSGSAGEPASAGANGPGSAGPALASPALASQESATPKSAGPELANPDSADGTLCLEHLLRLSTDLIQRLMRDAGIETPEQPQTGSGSPMRSVVLQEIEDLVPSAAQRGGRLYRLLAVTPSQLSQIGQRLKQLDMNESCTIVPARFGEVPVAVCDAGELNLPGLISGFWRPSSETFQLAERLHTRSDVAWPSIDTLLAGPMLEAAL